MKPLKANPTLSTERLILRPFRLSDAPDIQHLAGAREVAEMTINIPHPYETGMAEQWIASHADSLRSGTGVVCAITLKASGVLIGATGLAINPVHQRAELGYWIGRPYWGQGYATEAAAELLRFGFQTLKLNRIHATHMSHNPASGRVMQNLGMNQEGILRQHAIKWDKYVDMVVYGILATAWRQAHRS